MKPRIYIDTSVIGGCFDEEFQEWSNKLFDEFIRGNYIAIISDVTTTELDDAPNHVKGRIDDLPPHCISYIKVDDEIKYLASKYIELKAVSSNNLDDATHIAAASVNKADILVSWNFKHIVNARRIKMYNSVNMMYGYQIID
ncbi:MAG: PIN domain protein, partial [Bacteroidetes bacterium]|nr:PIN domain protein [Bacteroidota bacterium]